MHALPVKLALTGSIAALLWAIPVSVHLGQSSPNLFKTTGIGLAIDTVEARVGRPATPASVAGVSRRTTRRTVRQITPGVGAAYVSPVVAGAAVAGTAVAVGTTVAALPAHCTTVVYQGAAYRRCGSAYYRAAGGTFVAVNPPL